MRAPTHVVILGAGPAGLMAAYELARSGIRTTVLERQETPGGQGGTTVFEGRAGTYRFDFGGHRFITANRELMRLVDDLMGPDLLVAERHSVIRFGGRVYDYPLNLPNLLRHAPGHILAGAARDLARQMAGRGPVPGADFASWTAANFGPTLYRTFFAGYTQKLWGVPPETLSADWAEQRISLVDLRDVARRLLPGAANNPRTYARSYRYPRHGFGAIFDRLAARVVAEGGEIRTGVSVTGFDRAE
ncbi:FAD-dependent oxidoreductase, partial [Thioclava sp. BHET1]